MLFMRARSILPSSQFPAVLLEIRIIGAYDDRAYLVYIVQERWCSASYIGTVMYRIFPLILRL